MHTLSVNSYEEWYSKAKEFLYADVAPAHIIWESQKYLQTNLLSQLTETSLLISNSPKFHIPKTFFELAKKLSYHRSASKWSLLYEALWRITHGEKHLLEIKSDPLVHKLFEYEKAIRRDAHKMKAFVRFRLYAKNNEEYYLAWFKPDHCIVEYVAPFFKRRFEAMNWIIITPDQTAIWYEGQLSFKEGVDFFRHPQEDELEQLWVTYYGAIFNPARIKIKAMKNEMPVRYWKNLPETKIIPQMLQDAPARVDQMLKWNEGLKTTAKDYLTSEMNYEELRDAAASCKACPIHLCAKRTVFGNGNQNASIMIVAEQPGSQEDLAGVPLIGPSGNYLKKILLSLDINPETVYLTNAVKHFKHRILPTGISYQTPTIKEIYACKPWLEAEINLIRPKVILSLGLIAAKTLLNPGFHLKDGINKSHYYESDTNRIPVIPSYHPAAILRNKNPQLKTVMETAFIHAVSQLRAYIL